MIDDDKTDWCDVCEKVTLYDGHTCTACGREWGEEYTWEQVAQKHWKRILRYRVVLKDIAYEWCSDQDYNPGKVTCVQVEEWKEMRDPPYCGPCLAKWILTMEA